MTDSQVEEVVHLVEEYLEVAVGARTGRGYDLDSVSDAHCKLMGYLEELEAEAMEEEA